MAPVAGLAKLAQESRKPISANNPFLAVQENLSRQIVAGLDAWRDLTEMLAERAFLSIYGSPALQAAVGINSQSVGPLRKAPKSPLHGLLLEKRIAELRSAINKGGAREAVVRATLYVGLSRGSVDERGFELVRRIRAAAPGDMPRQTQSEFKVMVRDQYFMLLIDEEAALAAIPALLPGSAGERRKALSVVQQVLSARGELTGDASKRMNRIENLFNVDQLPKKVANVGARSKAS
jgi:hypothetical protein